MVNAQFTQLPQASCRNKCSLLLGSALGINLAPKRICKAAARIKNVRRAPPCGKVKNKRALTLSLQSAWAESNPVAFTTRNTSPSPYKHRRIHKAIVRQFQRQNYYVALCHFFQRVCCRFFIHTRFFFIFKATTHADECVTLAGRGTAPAPRPPSIVFGGVHGENDKAAVQASSHLFSHVTSVCPASLLPLLSLPLLCFPSSHVLFPSSPYRVNM